MAQETRAGDTGVLPIGLRIRRIRIKKKKTLATVAGLAGISTPHLSRIERGKSALNSRSLAHRIAGALEVPLTTLFEEPAVDSDAEVAAGSLRLAFAGVNLASGPTSQPPPWGDLSATRDVMVETLYPRAEFLEIALLLPELLTGFHAHSEGPHRQAALIGMADCFRSAHTVARQVGAYDLGLFAGCQLGVVAAGIDGPEWVGLGDWANAQSVGTISRRQARDAAVAALDRIDGELDNPSAVDVAGMLHLLAAQAKAVLGQTGDVGGHLVEATRLANRPGTGRFANLQFTPWNVRAWETTIAVELGEAGRAMQLAQTMDELQSQSPPTPSRHAAWLIDIGRAAAASPRTRPVAKRAFLEAEQLAPQRLRMNPWAKATVMELRNRARSRDRGLEDLAERMGVA
jgi:transcriptional regulator with XRE-family HTH domain